MKRTFTILCLSLALTLAMTGCGTNKTPSVTPTPATTTPTVTPEATPDTTPEVTTTPDSGTNGSAGMAVRRYAQSLLVRPIPKRTLPPGTRPVISGTPPAA